MIVTGFGNVRDRYLNSQRQKNAFEELHCQKFKLKKGSYSSQLSLKARDSLVNVDYYLFN